jgi:hypothetical protein
LSDLSQELVRSSMIKGAKIIIAVGCGLALVTATNAKKSVVGAVAGGAAGAAGALIGHDSGKAQISRRVELVDPNQLVRKIKNLRRFHSTGIWGQFIKRNMKTAKPKFKKQHCIGKFPDTQRVTSNLSH